MPLVSPGSNSLGIDIPITSDSSDFSASVDRVRKKIEEVERLTKSNNAAMKAQADASAHAAKTASMSWTDFRSMYQTVLDVVRVGQAVWAATGQEFVNYAEQVKNLSRNIGVSAEDASRLIQVADDVRISYSSLGTALKIAQKGGIDTSVEGLAKLADQYQKLAPGIERTQFLMKTFGRSGMEMGKLLEQGGDGVREMAGEIDKSLIITEAGIKASDEYQAALDEFNDSVMALKISIGNELLPTMTKMLVGLSHTSEIREEANRLMREGLANNREEALSMASATVQAAAAESSLAESAQDASLALDDTADALDAQKEAVKAAEDALSAYKDMLEQVSQANTDFESASRSVAADQKKYAEDVASANANLDKAISEGSKEGVAEAKQALQELQTQWHESANAMIYDMTLAGVAVDGLTNAELEAVDKIAVDLGIKTQADIDETNRRRDIAKAYIEGVAADEAVVREQSKNNAAMTELEKQVEIAKTGDVAVSSAEQSAQAQAQFAGVVDSATQSLIAQAQAAQKAASAVGSIRYPSPGAAPAPRPAASSGSGGTALRRDSGGAGYAGQAYMIGTGAQPEVFIPSTNGNFVPNANKSGLGATYNIVVNNPRKETAENSIRTLLKNLNYIGAAA